MRKAPLTIGSILAFAFLSAGEGCRPENAIVGGECAPGYEECAWRCLPAGQCASGDGSTWTDGSDADGSWADGSRADASFVDGSSDGGADAADACPPPPWNTASACGACDVQCVPPNGMCRLDGNGAYACQSPCAPPTNLCRGQCVDMSSDPMNCGACGKICPSNLCTARVCQGATPGDIVVIGHDYRDALSGSSQARVLTNAVFIPMTDPLRVLSYERHAEPQAVTNVKSLIQIAAGGRTVTFTTSNSVADVGSSTLAQSYDVVLVYDQLNGSLPALTVTGGVWAPYLATFTKAGGIVVVLDGNAGQGNMPVLIKNAGLLDLAGHTSVPAGTRVAITAPADRIATLVASPYGAFNRSVTFQSNEPNGGNVTWVARHDLNPGLGDPVAIHKVVP